MLFRSVFFNVDNSKCSLYVPLGSKALYLKANQWKDFKNIIEIKKDLILGLNNIKHTAAERINNVQIHANIYTERIDQSGLKIN